MINGVTQLFMTKADVLQGFSEIRVCTSYSVNGAETQELPFENDARIEPVYTSFKGWNEDISSVRIYEELPKALTEYVSFIEKQTGVPVTMVSVGPDRQETIFRNK
jgi:adenylosuccinate synthase